MLMAATLFIASCGDNTTTEEKTTEGESNSEAATETEETTEISEEGELYVESKLKADPGVKYSFQNASVHDPSVIKVDDTYYVFGSHLAAAKSTDLMNWQVIANGVNKSNKLFEDVTTELAETLEWSQTNTLWAPDVIQLADGRFYMYYCACKGDAPISDLGIAVADNIEGPYTDLGIILKSGMDSSIPNENGETYNATRDPNAVDPDVFFDKEGRLWMVYGSYSGGIFILELNPETGFPLESGYGKKLLGGNHLRIEGPYILYSPESDYYYLFLSYGGLDSTGGYNIRVARSKTPDGPYLDVEGNDLSTLTGPSGSFFDDTAAAKMGTKILGNFKMQYIEGESGKLRNGYVSPGHNSAYYSEEEGKYFLIFHTRFESRGEGHEVRVHQMYLNEDDWFVVSPYRYVGETMGTYTSEDVAGPYKLVNQMHDISKFIKKSSEIWLQEDGTITGDQEGTWVLGEDNQITITLQEAYKESTYKGVFTKQWDEDGEKNVMVFTALSDAGISILGSGIYAVE